MIFTTFTLRFSVALGESMVALNSDCGGDSVPQGMLGNVTLLVVAGVPGIY